MSYYKYHIICNAALKMHNEYILMIHTRKVIAFCSVLAYNS